MNQAITTRPASTSPAHLEGRHGDVPAVQVDAQEDQYVTFTVGDEEYGVKILSVREIRGWTPESKLPNLPDYVRGVINLRGVIIPIFDLRARFGGGATQVSKRHVVVVIQVRHRVRGILVDAISDILSIRRNEIQPPPDLESGLVEAEYLSGLYTAENRLVTLLDVDRLFAAEAGEQALVEARSAAVQQSPA